MKNACHHKNFYGLVLAGGESRRMGADKAMIIYHGKPQWLYCYELLQEFCEKVFLSVHPRQADVFERQGINMIYDNPAFAASSPSVGILSAMERHPDVSWLVLACDLPLVDRHTLSYLVGKRNTAKPATAFKSVYNGLPEPLCSIYEKEGRPHFEKLFSAGTACPRKMLLNTEAELLDLPDPHMLDNINTPAEYQAIINK